MHFKTARLEVRDIVESDACSLHIFRQDSEVARFMDFEVESLEETKRWVQDCVFHNKARPRFGHLASVLLRTTGEVIGYIGVGRPDDYLRDVGDLDFGYALRRDLWGQGLMPEAIKGMLAFCFQRLNVNSVFAQCSKMNRASARALEKAGMVFLKEFMSAREKDGLSLIFIARKSEWNCADGVELLEGEQTAQPEG